jgi:hypothetical protein
VNLKSGGTLLLCLALLAASSWSRAETRIHYSTLYKPATVMTTRGEVVSLGTVIAGNGKGYCETLTLKTDRGSLWVVLKPQNFRPPTNLNLKPRDQVEITGSRLALPGKTALLAATVKRGADTMVLRDVATGRPAWATGDDWHAR